MKRKAAGLEGQAAFLFTRSSLLYMYDFGYSGGLILESREFLR